MTTLKVVMLIHSYYPYIGGAERQIQALAPRLQKRGIEIHIVTRRYKGLAAFEVVQGVPVHRIPVPGPKQIGTLSYMFGSLPVISSIAPDILHAHDLLSPTTTAILAGWLLGVPVISKVLRGGVLGDIYKIRNRVLGRVRLSFLRRYVDMFIVISHEIGLELREVGIPIDQRLFLPNGVDIEKFMPITVEKKLALRTELGLSKESFIIIYVGRLVPEKRVEHLLTVLPKVRERHADAILIIAGSGDEEVNLKSMAGAAVGFLGRVDEINKYMQCADLFVLPSITEGLSNSLLEALATGLPVVATRVGGATDVIENGVSGFVIPPDDPDALLNAILEIMDSTDLQSQMGRQARSRVMKQYSLESVADNLASLYCRLSEDRTL